MKNKYQEALNYFLDRDEGENITVTCDWLIYAKELQELVDKETPTKPYKDGKKYKCSRCKLQRVSSRYCIDCGQKIDWSKDE